MKNKFFGKDILLLILAISTGLFGGTLAGYQPKAAAVVVAVLLVVSFAIIINIRDIRKKIKGIFYSQGKESQLQQISLEKLNIPVAIVSKDTVAWYNNSFKEEILKGSDCLMASLDKLLPDFDINKSVSQTGYNAKIGEREFTVYSSYPTKDTKLWVSYFVDDTVLKFEASEYRLSRPIVMQIVVDTYDDILKDLKESTRALIMAKLDQMMEDIGQQCNGLTMKIGTSRYHIIVEDRHFNLLYGTQFDILSKVREIDRENSVTISVGVGKGGKDFAENDLLARQALDMALGRGGDQAVVKTNDGYEFFGGVSRSVEKRSKVRSRIVSKALKDVILQSDNVIIMGHKLSDLDSVGAAIGVAAAVESFERKANIVVNEEITLAENLIKWAKQDSTMENVFIHPDKALSLVGDNTLLVIVDTHVARMTEFEELCKHCKKKVVIDHHRRMVDYITDTVVSYHEPYASSASELVTEVIQYILPSNAKLTSYQAGALLSGIMLDTRNFSEKAGVRTFEAAAYLRRQNAEPSEILKLFAIPKDIYTAKAALVNKAEFYRGVAISMSDQMPSEAQLAVPQAANDLLMLEGIDASVVAVQFENDINISARSLGQINVQVLMEFLGGGGHLTMAGAQLKNTTLEQAKEKIQESIDNYKK